MKNWLSQYLSPSQLGKAYLAVAVVVIFVAAIPIMEMLEPKQHERKDRPKVENLITEKKGRQFGLDAVSGKVTSMEKLQSETDKKLERLVNENKQLKTAAKQSAALSQELEQAIQSIKKLEQQVAKNESETQKRINDAVKGIKTKNASSIMEDKKRTNKNTRLSSNSDRRPTKNGAFSYGKQNTANQSNSTSTTKSSSNITASSEQNNTADSTGRNSQLFTIIETSQPAEQQDSSDIYLPRGAILTGVLITGLDAPTSSSASENPIPVLVRIKKEAILPNYAVLQDVRECFAIMAGYGDLSTERANLRGESITCVRNDGGVIEASFGGFAVGEDGKNGLKGTLVTRNSSVLANAMMAGFASGLSSMFDVNPVPVIATDSTGTQQYDSVFNSSAVKGGAAQGASNAMEKLADYYMKLADAMHPVIEVGAGRVVDMIVTKGTNL